MHMCVFAHQRFESILNEYGRRELWYQSHVSRYHNHVRSQLLLCLHCDGVQLRFGARQDSHARPFLRTQQCNRTADAAACPAGCQQNRDEEGDREGGGRSRQRP